MKTLVFVASLAALVAGCVTEGPSDCDDCKDCVVGAAAPDGLKEKVDVLWTDYTNRLDRIEKARARMKAVREGKNMPKNGPRRPMRIRSGQ